MSGTSRGSGSPPRVPDGWPPTEPSGDAPSSPPLARRIEWIEVRDIPWATGGALFEHLDTEERPVAAIPDAGCDSLNEPVRVLLLALDADPPVRLLPPGFYDDAEERDAGVPGGLSAAWPSESRAPYPAKDAVWEWERIIGDVRQAVAEFLATGRPGLYCEGVVRVTLRG